MAAGKVQFRVFSVKGLFLLSTKAHLQSNSVLEASKHLFFIRSSFSCFSPPAKLSLASHLHSAPRTRKAAGVLVWEGSMSSCSLLTFCPLRETAEASLLTSAATRESSSLLKTSCQAFTVDKARVEGMEVGIIKPF